jgi:hypothetical protein
MKIAVVSIVYKPTPPTGYGGIERVVHTLVEELVRQGHEVTLFGTPGSYCSGTTIEVAGYDPSKAPSGITHKSDAISEEPLYHAMADYLGSHPVDVIHDWSFQNLFVLRHRDAFPFVISSCIPIPAGFQRPNLVGASRAHAAHCGGATKYVHFGIDLDKYQYSYAKKEYFVHIAKIARYKGQHLAVLALRRAKQRLLIAGNVEDRLYFNAVLRPLLWVARNASYIGEIQGTSGLLREALALVQTPQWLDTFPFVILEAFASATPVISFRKGGVPEQIVHGVNGFLCDSVGDMAEAAWNIRSIRPQDCRAYAEEHFSSTRMARDYLDLYTRVADGEAW